MSRSRIPGPNLSVRRGRRYILIFKFLSLSYLKWSKMDIPITSGLRNRFESSLMGIFGGNTNFRDRVTNWTNGFKYFSPSKNEALGPHLGIHQGHVTYVALCRYVLAFTLRTILKPFLAKNLIFLSHVTSCWCHIRPQIFQCNTWYYDIGHVTHPRLRRARYI